MKLVYEDSLAATLDALNQVFFYGQPLLYAQREQAAEWIAGRIGQPSSYWGLPAPTARDFAEGAALFTGERTNSRAGTAHILGEEACRALHLLGSRQAQVVEAQHRMQSQWRARLEQSSAVPGYNGIFCCGRCTTALIRNLAAGGLPGSERRLAEALQALRAAREDGRWKRFPYHYTLLALSETQLPAAVEELRYAAPGMQRSLSRLAGDEPFTVRRRALLERALAIC